MAKLIGFSENFRTTRPTFKINNLRSLEKYGRSYAMNHDGSDWGIGYQRKIRYFLDDGTFVDFANDFEGQIRFLKDYIANGGNTLASRKLELASEVEFMDI